MKYFTAILLICLSCISKVEAQANNVLHQAKFDIFRIPGSERREILVLPYTIYSAQLIQSDINNFIEKSIKLKSLEPSGAYNIVFSLESKMISNDIVFGLQYLDENFPNYKILVSGTYFRIQSNNYFSVPATFTENTQFKIQKCPNQILFFVDNDLIKVDALSSSESYEVFIEPKDCYGTGIDKYLTSFMQISDIQTCELYDPFGKHIVLHTKFPTTVSLINGLKLRISYIEKYQTVDGEEVKFNIKDKNGNLVVCSPGNGCSFSQSIINHFGLNDHSIDLPEGINSENGPFLLTLEGPNKNSIYYIKFNIL